jgi:hypothetical protein
LIVAVRPAEVVLKPGVVMWQFGHLLGMRRLLAAGVAAWIWMAGPTRFVGRAGHFEADAAAEVSSEGTAAPSVDGQARAEALSREADRPSRKHRPGDSRSSRRPEVVPGVEVHHHPVRPARDNVGRTATRPSPSPGQNALSRATAADSKRLTSAEGSPRTPAPTPPAREHATSPLPDEPACRTDGEPRSGEPAASGGPCHAGGTLEKSGAVHKQAAAVIESLVFENGEIPNAHAALERMKKEFTKCALSGPSSAEGTVELRFIVRAPGRAEGVDVARVRGVSSDIVRCATSVLAQRYVGSPSVDPVGATVTVRFTKD